jgi:hypothetical protein
MRVLAVIGCIGIFVFCVYGFLASFEPNPNQLPWRLGYASVGLLACGLTAAILLRR